MAGEDNKAVVRRVYDELFNHGRLEVVEELFTPDFISHEPNPLPNQPLHGQDAVRWYIGYVRGAFPDVRVTVEDLLGEGDEVAVRFTLAGTQSGQFVFLPPTGKKVHVMGIDLVRFQDGKISAHWGGWNRAELLVQLGIFPGTEGTQL